MPLVAGIVITSYNLAGVVDREGVGPRRAGHVDGGVLAVAQEESMAWAAAAKVVGPHDLAAVVHPERIRRARAGHAERGEVILPLSRPGQARGEGQGKNRQSAPYGLHRRPPVGR